MRNTKKTRKVLTPPLIELIKRYNGIDNLIHELSVGTLKLSHELACRDGETGVLADALDPIIDTIEALRTARNELSTR